MRYEYKILEAESQRDIERKVNELAQSGFRLASFFTIYDGRNYSNSFGAVMELQLA